MTIRSSRDDEGHVETGHEGSVQSVTRSWRRPARKTHNCAQDADRACARAARERPQGPRATSKSGSDEEGMEDKLADFGADDVPGALPVEGDSAADPPSRAAIGKTRRPPLRARHQSRRRLRQGVYQEIRMTSRPGTASARGFDLKKTRYHKIPHDGPDGRRAHPHAPAHVLLRPERHHEAAICYRPARSQGEDGRTEST